MLCCTKVRDASAPLCPWEVFSVGSSESSGQGENCPGNPILEKLFSWLGQTCSLESGHVTAGMSSRASMLLIYWKKKGGGGALRENLDLMAAELGEVGPVGESYSPGGVSAMGASAGRCGGGAVPRASFPALAPLPSPSKEYLSLPILPTCCFKFHHGIW